MTSTEKPEDILIGYLTKYFCLAKEHRQALEQNGSMETALKVLESNLKELQALNGEIAEILVCLGIKIDISNPRGMVADIHNHLTKVNRIAKTVLTLPKHESKKREFGACEGCEGYGGH